MQTKQAVTCPIEGLTDVVVVFDMMASQLDYNAWIESMGAERTDAVIASVENWPEKYGEPFGGSAPVAFRVWATGLAWKQATADFLMQANSLTLSTPSTPPTAAAPSSRRRKNTRA